MAKLCNCQAIYQGGLELEVKVSKGRQVMTCGVIQWWESTHLACTQALGSILACLPQQEANTLDYDK